MRRHQPWRRAVPEQVGHHLRHEVAPEPGRFTPTRTPSGAPARSQGLGLDPGALSAAGSALVSYVLGSTAQYVAGPRTRHDEADRKAYLDRIAAQWVEHDPDPLIAEAATQLREHDDREQFLAGVDIFSSGTRATTSIQ